MYNRESRETPRHHSLAAGCVRAQDASLCFNSVVSLQSSSSLLGNKNILVFPPNECSGGSQMCKRGGGGGGSSSLRLNWGAGRGDLQHKLLSSRRGSPQPRLSPLTPHPWPEGWGREGKGGGELSCEELRECKQPITTYRVTPPPLSHFFVFLLEQSQTDDADSVLLCTYAYQYCICVLVEGWHFFYLLILVPKRELRQLSIPACWTIGRRIPSILPGPRERPPANTEELSGRRRRTRVRALNHGWSDRKMKGGKDGGR